MPINFPPQQQPQQVSSLAPLGAGMLAGAIEGFVTYPAEFLKTRAQFATTTTADRVATSRTAGGSGASTGAPTPLSILRHTLSTRGLRGLYSGSTALVFGNSLKAGVRFMTYDGIKNALKDDHGKLSQGRGLLAGLGAGVVEAVVAVTPSETIKTKLIADAQRLQPIYTHGTMNGTLQICRSEGLAGIYRGLGPTILKQGANSAVRFTSYNAFRDLAVSFKTRGQGGGDAGIGGDRLGSIGTFVVGAAAGIVTVYTTMPLDNLKTRMQTLGAENEYRNSLHCLQRIIREEGISRLWGGTTPRLARLSLSGGIVFVVYEAAMQAMQKL